MNEATAQKIEGHIEKTILKKIHSYRPKGMAKPFHMRLLGEKNIGAFERIHSLNTTFGTAIFEWVGAFIAEENFAKVEI